MEPLMLRVVDAARQLRRPVRENYVPPVEKIQNFFESAKGINIEVLQKELPKSNMLRATVLFDTEK